MRRLLYSVLFAFILLTPLTSEAKMTSILKTEDIVEKGQKLEVEIELTRDTDNREINVYQAILEYDENIFLGIDEKSIETRGGFENWEYNPETHALILINKYGTSGNNKVVKFDMVLKSTAKPSQTTIKLLKQVVSNEVGDYAINDVTKKIDINASFMDLGVVNSTSSFANKPLTNNPVKIYHVLTLIVLELVIAVIVVLIYTAIRKRISNKALKTGTVFALIAIELFALSAVVTYDIHKGDINRDGKINMNDINLLAKHIINREMISEFNLESADMNGDGYITPTDLSILIDRANEKKSYEVNLKTAFMESNGYEKGSEIDLRFLADVSNSEQIDYVVVDGERKRADYIADNEYAVKVKGSDISKKYNYNISEVVLKNGKSAKVDYNTEVVILKETPVLSAVSTRADLRTSSVNVAFTLTDEDDAIVSAVYELVDQQGKTKDSGDIDIGKNLINLKLDNALPYKLKFKIDYNRTNDSREYIGSIEEEFDLKIITDYRLKMDNFKLVQDGVITNYLDKTKNVSLIFNSSNVSGFAPKKLNIDGREYAIATIGWGTYKVDIPNYLLDKGELNIVKTTLANGKTFSVGKKIEYTILKNKPTVTYVNATEDVDAATMNIDFNIKDTDNILDKLVIKLYDNMDRLISEEEIQPNASHIVLPTAWTNKYKIRIFGDYERAENVVIKDEKMYEGLIDAVMRADIKDLTVNLDSVNKNARIDLFYNLMSNYTCNVKGFVIDNVIYDAVKVGLDAYKVTLAVDDQIGMHEYKTMNIIFDDGRKFSVDRTAKTLVLKDAPVIDNYSVTEHIDDGAIDISFDLLDIDEAFKDGTISLIEKETGITVDSKNVILGKNRFRFNLDNAVKYDISIDINGALGDEVLGENYAHLLQNYNLYRNEYRIISDYELEVSNIETIKRGVPSNQFGAGENIEVQFESHNVTEYVPLKIKVNGNYYDIEQQNGKYKFTLPGFAESKVQTLTFESIVLSNHKEVEISYYKLIEVLKMVPYLYEIALEEKVEGLVRVSTTIADRDAALFGLKANVVDNYGLELYDGELKDGSFEFVKSVSESYTIKLFADYDLNNGTDIMEENRFIGELIYEGIVDSTKKPIDTAEIKETVLFEKDGTVLEKMSADILEDLTDLKIKIILNDAREYTYDILDYFIEDEKLKFLLKSTEWVTTTEGRKTNLIKVDIPFE